MQFRKFILAVGVAAGTAVAIGCSSDPVDRDVPRAEPAGLAHLALVVAPGIDVNQVSYQVTGNGQNVSGTIDTNDPNATPSVQVGLPAATGYQVSMSAVSTAGVHCAGSAIFNISAGSTTQTLVNLLCDATNNASTTGATQAMGQFTAGDPTTCPDIAFYTVSPLRTSVGAPFTLNGAGTSGTALVHWTAAPDGTILDPNAANTFFVCGSTGVHTLTFTVSDGKSCVDSQSVNVNCIPADFCGNGGVDPGEQCDDGNTISGDGCDAGCQFESICGNGILEPGETCDDGNTVFGDGCDSNCQLMTECDDGVVQPPEQCDPPVPGFCSPTCQIIIAECSDGFLQPGEQCDDGNQTAGDGCSPFCTLEVCGNGIIDPGEFCEPPNTPTCGPTCQPDPFLPVCGNGTLETIAGEQCEPPGSTYCDSQCHLGGQCTACEDANCGTVVLDCSTGANANACLAALNCSRVHDCYNLDPAICYCGSVDFVSCQTGAVPANGFCLAEYAAAASSSTPSQLLLDLTDPSTALGRAGFIQQCDNAFCPNCPQ